MYQKRILKRLRIRPEFAGDVRVYDDSNIIESAVATEDGKLIVKFSSLQALQTWNAKSRAEVQFCRSAHINLSSTYDLNVNGWRIYLHENICLINKADYKVCEECGEIFSKEDMIDTQDGLVCRDCFNEKYIETDRGEICRKDDTVLLYDMYGDAETVSLAYAECHGFKCEGCGKWFENDVDNDEGADGERYCQDCWDDRFCRCEDCGEIIYRDYAYYDDDDYPYCESCWQDHKHSVWVHDYHEGPDFVYHGDSDPYGKYIGTEIETEHGDYTERVNITLSYGRQEECIYQMHDGSLDASGIECITQPMTKEYFDTFDFEGWMDSLKEVGAKSHDTDDCGLHVHLSRTWLRTDDDDEQAVLIGRMKQFISDNQLQVERFARRSSNHWCSYRKSFSKEQELLPEEKKELHKDNAKCGDRYQSINNRNYDTYEFRIFRGTLNANTFRASVEFCLRLTDYILVTDEGDESWYDFLDYKPLPASMEKYLKERYLLTA